MDNLFVLLLLLSLLALVVGLIRPQLVKARSRKFAGLLYGGLAVLFFILFGITTPATPATSSNAVASTSSTVTASSTPQTEDQKLAAASQSALSSTSLTGTQISYKEVGVVKADSDRPAGSKMITVSYSVAEIYNKDALIRSTGKLSSATFRNVFAESPSISDVIIWYFGDTKDRYGNTKSDVILAYSMDRPTFSKINWTGFDEEGICDFLNKEDQLNGNNFNTSCHTLVNIQ